MSVPCEMLLHPELLNNSQLIAVIQERQLKIPNIEKLRREDLLELFHNFCVPYGQRRYRDSGRGRVLNSSRHIGPEVLPRLDIISDCPNRNTTPSVKLKPPPDLLTGHVKKIKLDHPIEKYKDCNKRKMEMDFVHSSPTPHKKERKSITWP